MHILFALLLFSYFFLYGRGLLVGIKKLSKKIIIHDKIEIFYTSINIFYPLIGIIFFSNIMFLLNFFIPLKSNLLLLIVSIPIIFNFYERIVFYKNKIIFLFSFLSVSILAISSYDINFQYDSGYYHLNYQNWLRESNLTFGLNNLNGAYGTSSIIDYLAAPFWLGENLIFLHYLTICFLSVLINFFLYHIFISKEKYFFLSSFFIIFYGFLDNFGFGGGRNGFFTIPGIIKPDIASGVLFYFSSIFLTFALYNKKYLKTELIFLNVLIIYAYQLKISSSLLFLFFFYILYISKKLKLKELFLTNLILLFWTIKNLLLTSCMIYPVSISCFNFPWFNGASISGIKNVTSDFNNAYILGTSLFDWFKDWILIEINRTVVFNFIFSLILLTFMKILLTRKQKAEFSLIPILFILSNLILWIIGAPHPRFVYGLFAYIISLLVLNTSGFKERFEFSNEKKLIVIGLCLVSIGLIPRINSYKAFIQNPLETPKIVASEIEYIPYKNGWVFPATGDQCWINLYCIPYDIQVEEKKYLLFDAYILKK